MNYLFRAEDRIQVFGASSEKRDGVRWGWAGNFSSALLEFGLRGRAVAASVSSGPIVVSFHWMPSIGSLALAVL
jgi:hypothetical protein